MSPTRDERGNILIFPVESGEGGGQLNVLLVIPVCDECLEVISRCLICLAIQRRDFVMREVGTILKKGEGKGET